MKQITFILIVIYPYYLASQSPPRQEIDVQQFVESLFATQDVDKNYAELYESLFVLYTNPIDLNNTTKEELQSLNILSDSQITALIGHIENFGDLLSIYELQSIEGYDLSIINDLLPFVKIGNPKAIDNRTLWQRIKDEENNYIILRYEQTLQKKKGFTPIVKPNDARYSGDAGKYYFRFRSSHNQDFSLGVTLEKDAGEPFKWEPSENTYGTDFQSFHFMVQNKGIVKSAILGDYQLQIGQGLLTSAGFAMGKGGETINTVRRNHLGLRPYTSVVESGFFRGGALTLAKGRSELTLLYSRLNNDAILRQNTVDAEDFVSSLQASGLHRTPSELAAKSKALEQVIGGNYSYVSSNNNFRINGTILHTELKYPIKPIFRNYNQFNFRGKTNTVIGASANYQFRNLNTFVEVGRSNSGGYGILGGIVVSLTDKIDWALHLRNYTADFHSMYGRAFGENTRNQNEKGIYWGMKYLLNRKITLSAYYDKFSFPWLRSNSNSPSEGYEYLARVQYKTSKTITVIAQFREEEKFITVKNENKPLASNRVGTKRNLFVNASFQSSKNLTLKPRIQASEYHINGQKTYGIALIQDISFRYRKFTISGRYALFDTDDYQNRQYVYEKDVLFAFSIPAYNGQGARQYIILQYKLNRKWHFWIRYASTQFRDRKKIGTGLEEIQGNTISTIKLQARIKF